MLKQQERSPSWVLLTSSVFDNKCTHGVYVLDTFLSDLVRFQPRYHLNYIALLKFVNVHS